MFGKVKVDDVGVLRLNLKTKILDYIGEDVLTPDEVDTLVYDILDIFKVKY
jgi:hypothetical protein